MSENKRITNLNDLGTDLLAVYQELRAGLIDVKTADAIANVAGKVIGATKVVLEYEAYKNGGGIGKIDLLEQQKHLKAS